MEMLSNRTPPSCIQANIFAMAKVIFPEHTIIEALPSIKHIKNLRTAMYTVTKTLAAYQLGKAKQWRQCHSDETSRRQTSLLNLLMGVVTEDNEFKALCIDLAIIAEDGSAEEQSRVITMRVMKELAILLTEWRCTTLEMFPNRPELIEMIPDPSTVDITRMLGVMVDDRRRRCAQKLKEAETKELEGARKTLIDAWFLHKQFFSPACWKTVEEANRFYSQLNTKKGKLEYVKEQILMRYIGLGFEFEEAHHPWSTQGRAYTPDELFDHLINVEMDAVEYMQQKVWPLDRVLSLGFRIQICYKYYDEEDGITEMLQWCTGEVVSIVRDKSENIMQ